MTRVNEMVRYSGELMPEVRQVPREEKLSKVPKMLHCCKCIQHTGQSPPHAAMFVHVDTTAGWSARLTEVVL